MHGRRAPPLPRCFCLGQGESCQVASYDFLSSNSSCSCCSPATGIEEIRNSNLYHLVSGRKNPCVSQPGAGMNKDLGCVDTSAFFDKRLLACWVSGCKPLEIFSLKEIWSLKEEGAPKSGELSFKRNVFLLMKIPYHKVTRKQIVISPSLVTKHTVHLK